jgi:hypothetical protein
MSNMISEAQLLRTEGGSGSPYARTARPSACRTNLWPVHTKGCGPSRSRMPAAAFDDAFTWAVGFAVLALMPALLLPRKAN